MLPESKNINIQQTKNQYNINSHCGAGGNRTRVQTRKPQAFYMLSPDLIFVYRLDQGHRPVPYLL